MDTEQNTPASNWISDNKSTIEDGMRFAIREGGRTIGAGVVSKIVK